MCGYSARRDDVFDCHRGLRHWNCSILSGPFLSAWKEIKSVLEETASLKVDLFYINLNLSVVLNSTYVCDVKVGCVHYEGVRIFGLIIPLHVELRIIDLLIMRNDKSSNS